MGDKIVGNVNSALVLGGGGATGMAWETGVLSAFEDLGVDLTKSDLVIGSSAGSFVGSALLSKTGMLNFLEIQKRSPNPQLSAADVTAAYQGWRQAFVEGGADRISVGRLLGQQSLAVARDHVASNRRDLVRSWLVCDDWHANLRVTAINAYSGELSLFGPSSGITLLEAVSASGAIPGLWPSVSLLGSRWIDGGMVSTTNALLAGGAARILILAPMPAPQGKISGTYEDGEVLSQKSEVTVVAADTEALSAMGTNIYDPTKRDIAFREGYRQGKAVSVNLNW